ncbi:hypothetical protein M0804_010482 [Polistes exclamans]|nr:hypothetical protein M0804_010482 [Polistes exclamans]
MGLKKEEEEKEEEGKTVEKADRRKMKEGGIECKRLKEKGKLIRENKSLGSSTMVGDGRIRRLIADS